MAMAREADYQDRKRPPVVRPVAEWLLVMRAELNEAMDDWVEAGDDCAALVEILQVMTVGMRCLTQHGVVEREELR
jgi:hypothetical protein